MDLFALVLVTITILTICGICLFIFICALHPKILRCLHRKKNETSYITTTEKLNESDNDLQINNLDSITKSSTDRDKRAYLKILERSVRTGRRIQDEKDNNPNIKNDSQSNSFYFLRQYTNKHLSPTTTTATAANIQSSTEI